MNAIKVVSFTSNTYDDFDVGSDPGTVYMCDMGVFQQNCKGKCLV